MSLYNLYDPDREMYWKPNKAGYTKLASDAGKYTLEECTSIVNKPNVNDVFMPLSEWVEVESYEDVPEGMWIVKLDTEAYRMYQVLNRNRHLSTIGRRYAYEESRVIAYKPLGELL